MAGTVKSKKISSFVRQAELTDYRLTLLSGHAAAYFSLRKSRTEMACVPKLSIAHPGDQDLESCEETTVGRFTSGQVSQRSILLVPSLLWSITTYKMLQSGGSSLHSC
jgi:hypothetical protein